MDKIKLIVNKIKNDIKTDLPKDVEWKEFVVEDIFECKTTKPLIHTKSGTYNYVTRSSVNNGVSDLVDNDNYELNKSNCITIGAEGGIAFYQNKDFVSGVKVYTLRHSKINRNIGLFLCTVLNKKSNKYSYSNARILDKIKKEIIYLPSKNNEPDWEYMNKFIENIIKNMNLEKVGGGVKVLFDKIKNNTKTELFENFEWKSFKIGSIFNVMSTKTRELTKYYEGCIPFVSGTSINNGVEKMVYTTEILEKGNCITVSSLDCSAFYQSMDFIGRGHGVVQRLYNDNLNKNNALFICCIIKKIGKKYNYNNQCFLNTLKEEIIFLPSKNNEPDWEYMDKFIEKVNKNLNLL